MKTICGTTQDSHPFQQVLILHVVLGGLYLLHQIVQLSMRLRIYMFKRDNLVSVCLALHNLLYSCVCFSLPSYGVALALQAKIKIVLLVYMKKTFMERYLTSCIQGSSLMLIEVEERVWLFWIFVLC